MKPAIPKATLLPPPGRPNWDGRGDLPLIYLGWGQRDFASHPLPLHSDFGTNYFIVLRGRIEVATGQLKRSVRGPAICIFDTDCEFSIGQEDSQTVEILVWIWRGRPLQEQLRPEEGGMLVLELNRAALDPLMRLHNDCRREVELSDSHASSSLTALQQLMEIELLRAAKGAPVTSEVRWELAKAWMTNNLSMHAPVPALCDYLGMSASTLRRLFIEKTGQAPGLYFRNLKLAEAERLVNGENWQVKAVAYHLGYGHPNDLSRALQRRRAKSPAA